MSQLTVGDGERDGQIGFAHFRKFGSLGDLFNGCWNSLLRRGREGQRCGMAARFGSSGLEETAGLSAGELSFDDPVTVGIADGQELIAPSQGAGFESFMQIPGQDLACNGRANLKVLATLVEDGKSFFESIDLQG